MIDTTHEPERDTALQPRDGRPSDRRDPPPSGGDGARELVDGPIVRGAAAPGRSPDRGSPKHRAKPVWNIRLPDGRIVAKVIGPERPTLENGGLKPGQKVASGPYPDLKTAIITERVDLYRAHLFRKAIEQGIFRASAGHRKPTLVEISQWTGYSVRTLKSWLQPPTSRTRRAMPLPALKLILYEFRERDQSTYDWDALLRKVR